MGRHPRRRRPGRPEAFTAQVYQQVLSGKPRMAGAMRAPWSTSACPIPRSRVDAYAEHKQAMVVALIEAGKFSAYPDALRFLLAAKDAGIAVAAASSSKNAGLFLRQIRLDEFARAGGSELRLDRARPDAAGRLRRRHLRPPFRAGQAAPGDLPDRRAELGVEPPAAFVIEDAVSGIQAAKAGGVRRDRRRTRRRRGAAGGGRRRHRRQHARRRRSRGADGATPRTRRRVSGAG